MKVSRRGLPGCFGDLPRKAQVGTIARPVDTHHDAVSRFERIDFPAASELCVGAAQFHVPGHALVSVFHVDEKVNVGVAPVNPGQRAIDRDWMVRIISRFQAVMRESGHRHAPSRRRLCAHVHLSAPNREIMRGRVFSDA